MAAKPKKKFSELTPAYRKRLEAAYKSGSFGAGYSSAGRAYAAGASRQVARGQASTKPGKLSEAERTARRSNARKAEAWSRMHARSDVWEYKPTGTPDEKAAYTREYLAAVKEVEKGWKARTKRKEMDMKALETFFKNYDINEGIVDYFNLSPKK